MTQRHNDGSANIHVDAVGELNPLVRPIPAPRPERNWSDRKLVVPINESTQILNLRKEVERLSKLLSAAV